jgi:hypothetical protein
MPDPHRRRVVGLIGCPEAGKTTYARRFDPLDGWVHLTLDDLRQTPWPPDRQVYWEVPVRRLPRSGRVVANASTRPSRVHPDLAAKLRRHAPDRVRAAGAALDVTGQGPSNGPCGSRFEQALFTRLPCLYQHRQPVGGAGMQRITITIDDELLATVDRLCADRSGHAHAQGENADQ